MIVQSLRSVIQYIKSSVGGEEHLVKTSKAVLASVIAVLLASLVCFKLGEKSAKTN